MRKTISLISCFLFIATVGSAFANHLIIVNKNNSISEISHVDLKRIYLLKKTNWENGKTVLPVNLGKNNSITKEFSKKIIGKSSKRLFNHYIKHALSGKGVPPKRFSNEKQVIKYVSSTRDAIGYVSMADDSVKVIPVKY